MRGINKVILLGNIGQDVELRYTPSKKAVTTISLATSETFKDENGNRQELTEWHSVQFWGKSAEILHDYGQKGTRLYVEGRNKTNRYQDEKGVIKYSTKVIAQTFNIESGGRKIDSTVENKNIPVMGDDVKRTLEDAFYELENESFHQEP